MSAGQQALFPLGGAVIDGPYRYDLWRRWTTAPSPAICAWVMLNPSTADGSEDDPTVRRCIRYSRAWGFGGMVIRNLFALRATNPRELLLADDPVGPDNDRWLSEGLDTVHYVVVAWGSGRYPRLGDRWRRAADFLAGRQPVCLRTARDGQPVHPLYQRADLMPFPWSPPGGAL